MNGVHDMGGEQCHGPIDIDPNEPVFHAEWQRRVLGVTLAAGAAGQWNLDISRFARESLPPAYYLSAGYYRVWLAALENLLVDSGMITKEELLAGKSMHEPMPVKSVLQSDQVETLMATGSSVLRKLDSPALFSVGDQVRVKNHQPSGHTRLPAYIRGKVGTIKRLHGAHVYPDSHAKGDGEDPKWLYNVEFTSDDLWGNERSELELQHSSDVLVDCWEPYLEQV